MSDAERKEYEISHYIFEINHMPNNLWPIILLIYCTFNILLCNLIVYYIKSSHKVLLIFKGYNSLCISFALFILFHSSFFIGRAIFLIPDLKYIILRNTTKIN